MPTADLARYIDAVPINAITAGGFGPLRGRLPAGTGPDALEDLRTSRDGVRLAMETIGTTGTRVLLVLAALGGTVSQATFAAQTAGVNPAELAAAMTRLEAGGLVHRYALGDVRLDGRVADLLESDIRSLADLHAVTVDDLALFCRTVGIAVPKLKAERIAALADAFADPALRAGIRQALSQTAVDLLEVIADVALMSPAPASAIGVERWEVRLLSMRDRLLSGANPTLRALQELVCHGIVGTETYDGMVWMWREAWAIVDRPLIVHWDVAERPPIVSNRGADTATTPPIVSVLDALLQRWRDLPPAVLKNDEPRVSRPEARTIAKALRSDEATVDLLARLAISMRLVLRNEVSRSGRGRNERIDYAWRPDPDLTGAWTARAAHHRWGRLVAEWCAPRFDIGSQLLANRHLTLWELQRLDADTAYQGDIAFCEWIGNRYGPIGHPDAVAECLADLRSLGMVTVDVVALTDCARALLADPLAAVEANLGEATRGFVQADLTVVAPPDLRHDLAALLERIATVQSRGGATIHRLDAHRITKAVQGDDTAETILEQLRDLAGAALPDTVTRLVQDAAARADAVQLIAAATVIIVDDPADLSLACAIKSLGLSRLTPTVAATEVAVAKVQAALEAKGIVPKVVAVRAQPTRGDIQREMRTQQLIERLRRDLGEEGLAANHAARLLAEARAEAHFDARLALPSALTLTPAAAAALVGESNRRG